MFLGKIAAEKPLIHTQLHESSPELGVAPQSNVSQRLGTLQSPRTLRQHSATEDGTLGISGFNIETSNRLANLIDFHKHYPVSGNDTDLIGWSGNVASCDEGTIGASYQDFVLRRINYF